MRGNFKCIDCGSQITASGIQPGDFCPNCHDGTLMVEAPIVFSSARSFLKSMIWENNQFMRKLKAREN